MVAMDVRDEDRAQPAHGQMRAQKLMLGSFAAVYQYVLVFIVQENCRMVPSSCGYCGPGS
jgi:hypothetical protein